MKRLSLLLLVSLLIMPVKAQVREFGYFVVAGAEDAEQLLTAYVSPYLNGFGASLSGGWYTTAKPHKLGGFDITITGNVAFVPDEFRTFNVDELDLSTLTRETGTTGLSPTIAGKHEAGPALRYNYTDELGDVLFDSTAFKMPYGTGFPYVPSGMIQASVGLIKGTEIIGRYLPKVGNDKAKAGFWGIGVKHDIKQWIPGLNKIPILNIAVMGGYTKMSSSVVLDVSPGDLNLNSIFTSDLTWDNQKFLLSSGSFTGNLLVSADLPVICFYGGVGFATSKVNVKLEGDYPMIAGINETTLRPEPQVVTDPVDFELKNTEGTKTKPRLNAGMRLKLGFFTIHCDYTRAKFNMVSAGIGVSFR